MLRDPVLLAECRTLVAALTPHPTTAALTAAPEWPALEARLMQLLSLIHI